MLYTFNFKLEQHSCSTWALQLWGFTIRCDEGSAQLKTNQSVDMLLICCCHIVCTMCCDFSVCHCSMCILCKWAVNRCPRLLTALNPILPVCSLCTAPLLLADQLPNGSPDKILGICRWNERRIKGWLLNTPWQRSGLLFSHSKPPPSSAACLYIYLFSQRHHREVQSAIRNKGKSTSRSGLTKMLMDAEKEKKPYH